jgi:glycerophosphoryl diester phosphodiesterase
MPDHSQDRKILAVARWQSPLARRTVLKAGVAAAACAALAPAAFAPAAQAAERTTTSVLPPYTRPTLIAHRGASAEAPEHTRFAYELALQFGADFVEPDLQMTKDGVLVCLHDTTLERTTNVAQVFPDRSVEKKGRKTWPVADFTLAEIQSLDAGSWKDERFAGAKVLTFQQMIDLVKGRSGIIPETKAPEVYDSRGLDMVRALVAVLRANGLDTPRPGDKTPVIIQSFSEASLKALRQEHGSKLPLVFLFSSDGATRERLNEIHQFADGIAPSKSVVKKHPEIVQNAHAMGMSVTVWTFRAGQTDGFPSVRDEMRHYLRELHVDALFTDNPDQFPRDERPSRGDERPSRGD